MSNTCELFIEIVDDNDFAREFKVYRNSLGEIVHEDVSQENGFGETHTSCVYINGEWLTGDGWRFVEDRIGLDKFFEAYEENLDVYEFMSRFNEEADRDEDGIALWSEVIVERRQRLASESSAAEIEAGFEGGSGASTQRKWGGSPCL